MSLRWMNGWIDRQHTRYSWHVPGTVLGHRDEAVNKVGTDPAPEGRADKQVVTIQCDETDSPAPWGSRIQGLAMGAGQKRDLSLCSLLLLLNSEPCDCIIGPE